MELALPFMKRKNDLTDKPRERYLFTFLLALGLAFLLFVPYIIMDSGYFMFYGDFNVQQIPFYKLAHQAVRSGNIYWSFGTDLGANFISSYSFYLLGSPFFWLTIPFPNSFVPRLIGPLLILKFACAALAAYAFLTRFIKNKEIASLGGILYAFSGFSVYNIFFNHFHEAIIYFPLLLLAIELFMVERRRGFFAIMVALILLVNYYFAFGMAVFAIIYCIVRIISGDWNLKINQKNYIDTILRILWFIAEAIIGVLISAIILLPATMAILENNRVGSYLTGWNGLVYSKSQMYWYILQSFLFPPELPARPVFFPDANVKWSSVAGWLPLFGLAGAFSFCSSKKGSWIKRIIIICGILAFVPIFNQAFSAFNYSYYARWFYMPVLMLILATCLSMEDSSINWKSGWALAFGLTVGMAVMIGFFPDGQDSDGNFTGYGVFDNGNNSNIVRFWAYCAIAICSLIMVLLLLKLRKNSLKKFVRITTVVVCAVSLLYAHFFVMTGHMIESYGVNNYIAPVLLKNNDTVKLPDANGAVRNISQIDDARFDVYKGMDNVGMYFGVSCIQAFQSIVPGSVMDFYPSVGVERTVGSRPEPSNYALRGLLSVKYVMDYTGDSNDFADENSSTPAIPGFALTKAEDDSGNSLAEQDRYRFYENTHFIPYGFTYDSYMTKSYYDSVSENNRSAMMLKAIVLDNEQIKKYSDILTDVTSAVYAPEGSGDVSADGVYSPSFTEESYFKDCDARAKNACTSFSTDNYGFTAKTPAYSQDELVFFSIPYEDGWSATVDGKPVDIEKVNIGFMAVKVDGTGSEHTIRFNYKTPYLSTGVALTFGGISLFIFYLVGFYVFGKKKREKNTVVVYSGITHENENSTDGDTENPENDFKPFDIDETEPPVEENTQPFDLSEEENYPYPDETSLEEPAADDTKHILDDILLGVSPEEDYTFEKPKNTGVFNIVKPNDNKDDKPSEK